MKAGAFPRCRIFALPLLVAMLGLAGCAKQGKLTGKVMYKGEPVPKAQIVFMSESGTIHDATADENGKYTAAKLPLGKMRIGVKNFTQGMADVQAEMMAKFGGAGKDNKDVQKSIESMRKETGASAKFVALPQNVIDPEKSGLSVEVKGGTQEFDIVVPE